MVPRLAQLSLVSPDVCASRVRTQDDACDTVDIVSHRSHHRAGRRVSLAIGVDGAAVPSVPHVHRTAALRETVPSESSYTVVASRATSVLTSSEPRFLIPSQRCASRDVGLFPSQRCVLRAAGRHLNGAHRARSTSPSRRCASRDVGLLPLHTRVSRSVGPSARNIVNKSLPFHKRTTDRGVRTLHFGPWCAVCVVCMVRACVRALVCVDGFAADVPCVCELMYVTVCVPCLVCRVRTLTSFPTSLDLRLCT